MAVANSKKTGESNQGSASIGKKLMFFLLVCILPIIIVLAMVGGALQFVGFPVWKTVESMVEPEHALQKPSVLSQEKQEIATLQSKIRVLSAKNDTLSGELLVGQKGSQTLESQISALKGQLATRVKAEASAEIEGTVLVQMDAGPASAVLASMSVQEAGLVVSTMAASDSGSILADLPAAKATQILALASKDEASLQTTTNSNGGTNPTVGSNGTLN